MTLGSISFMEAEVKVDKPFHYSPSASQWSGGTTEFEQQDTFKVNGHRLKPFMEPFNQDKEESTSLSHKNPNQKGLDGLGLAKVHGQAPRVSRSQLIALIREIQSLISSRTIRDSIRASTPTTESQIPSGMTPELVIRRPMVTQPPIEGNLDCRARPFHSELCFDKETFRFQQSSETHSTYFRGTIWSTL
ncbi:hypothetical protein CK203_117478 [Vitis vinifera]|uniref:Uncharacterized protein n=1 Tax=Vitis vinifera TaxID=29760 RepID=A0A438BMU3_VITVI|nr:hypothetical protein CK203_117478 [Vitis vinifera]